MVVISDSCSSDGGTLVRSEPVANAISGVALDALGRSSMSLLSGNRVFPRPWSGRPEPVESRESHVGRLFALGQRAPWVATRVVQGFWPAPDKFGSCCIDRFRWHPPPDRRALVGSAFPRRRRVFLSLYLNRAGECVVGFSENRSRLLILGIGSASMSPTV